LGVSRVNKGVWDGDSFSHHAFWDASRAAAALLRSTLDKAHRHNLTSYAMSAVSRYAAIIRCLSKVVAITYIHPVAIYRQPSRGAFIMWEP